ncbi:DNA ligase D [Sphingomonas sp. MAH-20]|uniref:DNA ligase (ATP) n=1 Tax=Sphingomonas horti TaxID=2682842 RepID=A0A6I4J841_9SPHN|nr:MULTISPECIES: DNA ligase D [Sphingomonas]MBA2918948.1 DNA ligase D [Sphingomonas sp. CGMCC 1.13658]MVO78981.1 DNA ligase D [Sphingomonas horti]
MADPLARYNAKRDFTKTAEPAGAIAKGTGHSFMVQKHDATRLHWDLRLEMDGVLKSWAVTRGPSLDPDDKRLAVRTEDHPLSYATFEGTIPKGEYGGGTVMLWDRGTWAPVKGKSAKDLEKGHLHFILDGERMKGEWLLIRLKPRPKERTENWLLRKIDDEYAGPSGGLVDRCLTSVSTGRTMDEIAAGKDPPPAQLGEGDRSPKARGGGAARQRRAGAAPPPRSARSPSPSKARGGPELPAFTPPQLATLVDTVPTGSNWLHEAKYDGYRVLLAVGRGPSTGSEAKLFTRTGLDWTDKFAVIAEAAQSLDVGAALIDGEVVALDQAGKPSFSALQDALSRGSRDLTMFAFDLLSLDGEELKRLPNLERKELLRTIIPAEGPILFAEHVIGEGEKLFQAMCREGFEGIVSKRADAPYLGKRTQNWLKIKCIQRQEFVIVGWTASEARGRGFRSLLLGLNEGGKLRYAGKVGTGFNARLIEELSAKLEKLKSDKPTVEAPRAAVRGAHWVKPQLVAEIAFAEFTADNVVRHGSFIGLREDKKPAEVKPEKPVEPPAAPETSVKISNPERVIYPDSGITKGQLASYYAQVSGIMLPWLANRPISLVRCPQGRAKKCFFQKHDAGSFGEHVRHVPVKEKNGATEDYLYVDSAEGLLTCVQMGTIEFHGWGSLVPDIERPNRIVFDLDPDEGLDFEQVKKAALDLKRYLGDLGLVTFPMLTGGKGVHVVAPLTPEAAWPAVKDFTHRFALALEQSEPERFVANMSKAKRVGRIFVDYLRNQRGATAIMPYAARARPHAPVAAPIAWDELKDLDTAARFTVLDGEELIERANSRPLKGWGVAEQVLPDF